MEEKKLQKQKDGTEGSESALYEIKDLLRMSLITDSPEETIEIVNAIYNLNNVQVVQVKNGFETKKGEEFDPTKYADIKMILLVGSGEDYQ